jgi:hypothetical protein
MKNTYIMVDVESNGPIPGDYSMTSLGATIIDNSLNKRFKVNIKPISKKSDPDREKFVNQKNAIDAKEAMSKFNEWLKNNVSGKPIFVSDNNGFDWMFVCWYFWHFLNKNPFGYSSQNLNSLYKGLNKNLDFKIDILRNRELSHNASEDSFDNSKLFLNFLKKIKE